MLLRTQPSFAQASPTRVIYSGDKKNEKIREKERRREGGRQKGQEETMLPRPPIDKALLTLHTLPGNQTAARFCGMMGSWGYTAWLIVDGKASALAT